MYTKDQNFPEGNEITKISKIVKMHGGTSFKSSTLEAEARGRTSMRQQHDGHSKILLQTKA